MEASLATRRNGPARAADRPKLSVYIDPALMKRLRREAVDSETRLYRLVEERLRLSYASHPAPLTRSMAKVPN